MADSIEKQCTVAERALGERMISHALVIIRSWLNELGEAHPYEESFASIESRYQQVFAHWLGMDDEHTDEQLNELTGEAYQLLDAVYADLRIQRGVSPDMHGFNPDSVPSVMQYFHSCLRITDADYQWLHDALRSEEQSAMGLVALGALVSNLRECFSIPGMMAVIDGILSDRQAVSEQCMANMFTLLIHYDVRIDFFPQIQDAFIQALREVDSEGETAFEVLCALVRSTHYQFLNFSEDNKEIIDQMPSDLRSLMSMLGIDHGAPIVTWMPKTEQEYIRGLVQILPDTWLYEILIAGDPIRERQVALTYLMVGRMDLMWDNPQMAEKWLVKSLRKGSQSPLDYLNYGHCLLLRGDRVLAYENYKQARQLCKNSKEFLALYRPDRGALIDHGVPVELVYLIEDQMLKS